MQIGPTIAIFVVCELALTLLVVALREAIVALATRGERGALPLPATRAGPVTVDLRPAELAYLMRPGDRGHTAMVLLVDLVHRAVKSRADGAPVDLAPYESRLWVRVSAFVREWADKHVQKVIPDPRSDNIPQFVKKASVVYRFFANTVRGFVKDVVADPRNIRRYFSVAGLMRLVADVGLSGSRDLVEQELAGELKERGLLVAEQRCQEYAKVLVITLVAGSVLAVATPCLILPSLAAALTACLAALFTAVCSRAIIAIGEFIPLYAEIREVISEIEVKRWWLSLLRVLLRLIEWFLYGVLSLAVLILVGVDVLLLKLLFAMALLDGLAVVVAMTAVWIALLEVGLKAYQFWFRPQPSRTALATVAVKRREMKGANVIGAFARVLTSPAYDPTFAELLAVYGVETLWLLA